MEKTGDAIFDAIAPLCDTIIWAEEIKPDYSISKEVYEVAQAHTEAFFEQVDKKIAACKSESEKEFVKDSTLNFLLFSTKLLLAELPDSEIERIANHFHKQILSVKRVK